MNLSIIKFFFWLWWSHEMIALVSISLTWKESKLHNLKHFEEMCMQELFQFTINFSFSKVFHGSPSSYLQLFFNYFFFFFFILPCKKPEVRFVFCCPLLPAARNYGTSTANGPFFFLLVWNQSFNFMSWLHNLSYPLWVRIFRDNRTILKLWNRPWSSTHPGFLVFWIDRANLKIFEALKTVLVDCMVPTLHRGVQYVLCSSFKAFIIYDCHASGWV